ncbi:MAG: hypothetical protein NT106_08675 [Candidatus Sumerlaeota bacterium]|nr:hypothetical protein [Candidatus Sumerlaeota bacterium]
MKKYFHHLFFIIFALLFFPVNADYRMMCTFYEGSNKASIFSVSNDGDIKFLYELAVTPGGEPMSIVFAPNGHWGLIGCNTTPWPLSQVTTVIGVNKNQDIAVIGFVHNEYYWLVAISPDSKYGVYGAFLQTLRFLPDNTFYPIPTNNSFLASYDADFSSLSGNLIAVKSSITCEIAEYTLTSDGKTTNTGVIMNISPATGNSDLAISPDGRTCIVLSGVGQAFTVLHVLEGGGFSFVQQFGNPGLNPGVVKFTPDSKYAIISFFSTYDLRSYLINEDSSLTEVCALDIPYYLGGFLGLSPDGKIAVFGALAYGYTFLYVVRVHDDGTLEYLHDKDYVCNGYISCIDFIPPYKTAADPSWNMYQ